MTDDKVNVCHPGAVRTAIERRTMMAFGGGGSSDNAFLIGPFLEWWDKRSAKRDAKRAARLEAKAAKRNADDGPTPH